MTFSFRPARRYSNCKPRRCVVCKTMFQPSRSYHKAKYCSKSCIWKATKGPEFNAIIARKSAPLRADKVRGTGSRGYVKRNSRHEHRSVAEEKLGRALVNGEVVHHVDGDKHNNDPANLQVMTQAQHMRLHGLGIPGKLPKRWEKYL